MEHTEKPTEDGLLDGRVRLLQPEGGYRAAVDPVMLASAVSVPECARVVDLGCGTGAAALCLAVRCPSVQVIGVEQQSAYADWARQSARLTGVADRVTVYDGDIRELRGQPPAWGMADAVMANPPFFSGGSRAPDAGRAAAHHEGAGTIVDWVAAAAVCLKPKGRLVMIQAATRLDDVLAALSLSGFGAVEVIPLWPKSGREAKRIVVRSIKGRRTPMRLCYGVVLHQTNGDYTREAESILRDMRDLDAVMVQDGD